MHGNVIQEMTLGMLMDKQCTSEAITIYIYIKNILHKEFNPFIFVWTNVFMRIYISGLQVVANYDDKKFTALKIIEQI